jgi:hypothetical protein
MTMRNIRGGVRDSEKGREPRKTVGPDVEVVAQAVEAPGDLIDGGRLGDDHGRAARVGPGPDQGAAAVQAQTPQISAEPQHRWT